MNSEVLIAAEGCRKLLAAGDCRDAIKQFLGIFWSCGTEQRDALVREFPEFFEGGWDEKLHVSLEFLQSDEMALISQTSFLERLGLLGVATAFKPQRLLEVGRSRGGSTILLSFAVSESGGRMVSVDPNNSVGEHFLNRRLQKKLEKQGVHFIDGTSPEAIGQASMVVNGLFDFVFIDADHSYDAVLADLLGVLPFVEENGYIVMHDANYPGVGDAVQQVVRATGITDCGLFCRDANRKDMHLQLRGRQVVWGGLHLLQVKRRSWLRRACLRWLR